MASRKQPSEQSGEPPDRLGESFEEEGDDNHCPVCGQDCREVGQCGHVVMGPRWDYGEGEGFGDWPGFPDPEELREVVEGLLETLSTRFTARQLAVVKVLMRLPSDLQVSLAANIDQEDFDSSIWTEALGHLIAGSPGFVRSASCDNEPSGPGTAGTWTNYWVRDMKACGRWLDKKLNGFLRALRRAEKAAAKLPEQTEE